MEQAVLQDRQTYLITIEIEDGEYTVVVGNQPVSTHQTFDRARLAASLLAHQFDLRVNRLEFEPGEAGNYVAIVAGNHSWEQAPRTFAASG